MKLDGNCLVRGVVYAATVTDLATGKVETYTGLTEGTFKGRWDGHKGSMKNRGQNPTTLSTYVWKLKDRGSPYTITWAILTRAAGFNPTTGLCRLCLKEKYWIMFHPETASLNARREVYSACRHKRNKLAISS